VINLGITGITRNNREYPSLSTLTGFNRGFTGVLHRNNGNNQGITGNKPGINPKTGNKQGIPGNNSSERNNPGITVLRGITRV